MPSSTKDSNHLFPVFLKLEKLSLLIVGGGYVGMEKLQAVIANSPATNIKLVAKEISEEIKELASDYPNLQLVEKPYSIDDLVNIDIVIAAINDEIISTQIVQDARAKSILVNAADKPELCDFYLSSVVKKGNLKIAISTNGKSPTIAKRVKEVITEFIPDELDDVLNNMQFIRNNMNGDFDDKVKQLNELTKVLVAKQSSLTIPATKEQKKWPRIVLWSLLIFVVILISHVLLSLVSFDVLLNNTKALVNTIDTHTFLLMLLTGFLAQMVDGSMGMGYGTISTTFLLAIGVPPAIVSSRVHSARVFSSGVAGFSHHRFGNINKKLFSTLVWPGVIGAIAGAALAVYAQNKNFSWVRIPLSLYTCYLGYFIIRKAYKKKSQNDKVKRAGWLASIGGFMDAFAGGGWGALVTSTLIAKRKSPRYVIGSVCLAEFFVVLASAVTFFILLKHLPIMDVLGLIIGGVIAGPIAARLVGKLPIKATYYGVGIVVILTSVFTLYKVISKML
jgi:hypothetical protein